MGPGTAGGRRLPVRVASATALLVALLGTAAAAWGVHAVASDQERRLLKERTSELNLVLTSAINAIPAGLSAQGGILKATHDSLPAWEQAAKEAAATNAGATPITFAWLRPANGGSGYEVVDSVGPGLARGDVIADARVASYDQAMHTPKL